MSRRRKRADDGTRIRLVCRPDAGHTEYSFGHVWVTPDGSDAILQAHSYEIAVTEAPTLDRINPHAVYNFRCDVCGRIYPHSLAKILAGCRRLAELGERRLNLALLR